jgi:type IV secretion system protein VirB6
MAMPTTMYTDGLNYINAVCESYVSENVATVARVVGPFLTAMLGTYVALWGFASVRGLIKEPINDFISRIVKLVVILGVGYNLANYNILITNTFLHGPDEFVRGLAKSSGATDVVHALDAMMGRGADLAGRFWAKAGVIDGDFGMYLVAGVVMGMTIVVTAYSFFLMAMAKVMLTAIICLGPVFFIGLLFEATAGFFNSWLRQLANYFLVPVLVVMVNLLILTLFSRAADAASGTAMTSTTEVTQVFPFLAMGCVCLLALASVLSVAAGLAGGVSLSSFGMGRYGGGLLKHHGKNLGKEIGRRGIASVAWSGKRVAGVARAVYQNRQRNSIRPAKAGAKGEVPRLTYEP